MAQKMTLDQDIKETPTTDERVTYGSEWQASDCVKRIVKTPGISSGWTHIILIHILEMRKLATIIA